MLRPEHIFLPATLLVFHSLIVILITGNARLKAVKAGKVDPRYFKLYQGVDCPDNLITLSRNITNLFELPVLFYLATVVFFLLNQVNTINLVLCALFVLLRLLHTFIHITSNKVPLRFKAFLIGYFVLVAIWMRIARALIMGG